MTTRDVRTVCYVVIAVVAVSGAVWAATGLPPSGQWAAVADAVRAVWDAFTTAGGVWS